MKKGRWATKRYKYEMLDVSVGQYMILYERVIKLYKQNSLFIEF